GRARGAVTRRGCERIDACALTAIVARSTAVVATGEPIAATRESFAAAGASPASTTSAAARTSRVCVAVDPTNIAIARPEDTIPHTINVAASHCWRRDS